MVKYPLTVRDAQRFVSSGHYWSWEPEYHALSVDIDRALGVSRHGYKYVTLQALARYAAQHGASAVLLASPEAESSPTSDRVHKIGTDEVEQSENPSEDSEMHGGDSASGEVESGTSEGGDNESGASSDTTAQAHTGAGTGGGEMGQGAGNTGTHGNALSQT